jgi:C4-type Zn-finger protein
MSIAVVPISERLRELLTLVAERVEDCPACGRIQFFVRTQKNQLVPYTVDGLNHTLHCAEKKPE